MAASTVAQYLAALPADRRAALSAVMRQARAAKAAATFSSKPEILMPGSRPVPSTQMLICVETRPRSSASIDTVPSHANRPLGLLPAEACDEAVLVPSAGVGIITDAAKKPSA